MNGSEKTIKALIIHLDRADERQIQVELLERMLPCPAMVLGAVDSLDLDDKTIFQFYRKQLYRPFYPFALSKNEIACFLSHRRAWQKIVDEGMDAGFIIEDDVALDERFDEVFRFAVEEADEESFIRFPFRVRETGKINAEKGDIKLIRPTEIGLGQVAQLVGRNAARKLLDATATFDRPVDTTEQLYWKTGVHPEVILPPVVREISAELGGSTIKSKHSLFARLYRELARPLYRHRIKVLSKRQEG
ncbi:Glycosyl transferase [Bartonella apis]|uniref:glycosyltransferase family 25 protein n=1 Tax=Bartonella apis TaxID=1686310 RepID=UPI003997B167